VAGAVLTWRYSEVVLRRLAFWSLAVVFPMPLVLTYNAVTPEPMALRIDIFFGLTAYSWWLLSIALSTRPLWLDRLVGLPAIYGLHGMLGILAIGAAYLHHEDAFASHTVARNLGNVAFWAALAVLLYSIFFLSGWFGDRSGAFLKAKRSSEKVIAHQLSVWVHRLNLVIVLMIFLHAQLLARVNQHLSLMLLLDLYTLVAFSLYAWKKWIAPATYLVGNVTSNEPRGVGTRVLRVDLDEQATKARPGDSVFLRFEGSPAVGREWHPFSLSDARSDTLTFTISQHGDFTRELTDVTAGTRVRLDGPYGRFDAIARGLDHDVPLVLLGMGAGVAPLLSLTAAHHLDRPLELLWAVRSPEHAVYEDEIDAYERAPGSWLKATIKVGRFTKADLTQTISEEARANGSFFIVGPSPAVLATQRLLRRAGIPRGRIHHERLTL
jgi:predicted ferric reductase